MSRRWSPMLPKPASCDGCPCPGEGFSRPEGRGTLGVLIVGEALGEHDGLPFRPNAPAGSVLERALNRVKWAGAPIGRALSQRTSFMCSIPSFMRMAPRVAAAVPWVVNHIFVRPSRCEPFPAVRNTCSASRSGQG